MDNHEFAELLKRLLDDEKFINSPQFKEFKEDAAFAVTSFVEEMISVFKVFCEAIHELITALIPPIVERIAEHLKEYLCTLTNTHPHIKHLALHSKKIRVRKKNYKRIYQRQKIP